MIYCNILLIISVVSHANTQVFFFYNIPVCLPAADLIPADCISDFRPTGSPERAEDIIMTLSAVASTWWVLWRETTTVHAFWVSRLSAIQIQWFIQLFKWMENRASLTQRVISALTHWHAVRNILLACYCNQSWQHTFCTLYKRKTV